MDNYIDAVEAACENYKLLSQEGNVRVIEMDLKAGHIDNEHSHHSETVYFIQVGKVKIHVGDEIMEDDIPDGHVSHDRPRIHRLQIVVDTDIQQRIFDSIP